jgi:hypothetical protein
MCVIRDLFFLQARDEGKVKVVPLPRYHTTDIYRKMEEKFHTILILALDGNEQPASCSGHFTPGNKP